MKPESASLRAVVFIDGQSLFRSAKEAFGHTYPNYDPMALAPCNSLNHGNLNYTVVLGEVLGNYEAEKKL
jgi:hypothetical protein